MVMMKRDIKGFPDIGEEVSKQIICTKRRIQNTQILYDMKKSNMKKIYSIE